MHPASNDAGLWKYAESIPLDRVRDLRAWNSFEEIARHVGNGEIADFRWETFKSERWLKGCQRASFVLKVSPKVYDAFFNSPKGYRAEYARSVDQGMVANGALLLLLQSRLLGDDRVMRAVAAGEVETERVRHSLRGIDAKLWVVEDAPTMRHVSGIGNEIIYPIWAEAPVAKGQRAPEGTLLEIKGGWLDTGGNEQRDDWKAYRSEDIHLTGWT